MVKTAVQIALISVAWFSACEKRPADAKADAKEDLREAHEEHREGLADAAKKDSAQERQEAIAEADRELVEAQTEADKEVRDANINASYGERFEVLEHEPPQRFATRAEERLAELAARLHAIEARRKTPEQEEDVASARTHLSEAEQELAEFRNSDGSPRPDDKLGAAIAINRAWKTLKDLDKETSP